MEQIEDKIEGQQQRMLQEQQCKERTKEKGDHQEGDQDVQLRRSDRARRQNQDEQFHYYR